MTNLDIIKDFSAKLLSRRKRHTYNMALKARAIEYVEELMEFLFPHFSERIYYEECEIESKLVLLNRNLKNLLNSLLKDKSIDINYVAKKFVENIPHVYEKLLEDAQALYEGDPAAESVDEVILAYPGFYAISIYRISHELYKLNIPTLPRVLTEYAHQITGVDIHPGAEIGKRFFIDHGTGVVIGETARIGNNVKIYQGVTLGALSVKKELSKTKRHPTIEDNVVIYSQAVILGGETVIGKNSIIGGNVWLTESVPPNSVVYHKSEVKVKNSKQDEEYFDFVI